MFDSVVGHSDDPDSQCAIEEILAQCKSSLTHPPSAGILLAAIDYDYELILQQIHQTFPGIQLIGGTTDGEMSSHLGFQQDSLVLMLFCSDEVEFMASVGRNVSSDPVEIAYQAAETAKAQLPSSPKLCLTIPESLTTSGVFILKGLHQSLSQHVPILGGTTGDQRHFNCTTQFFQTEVLRDSVPLLLMSGNLLVGYSIANGWIPMGNQGVVTKVDGNTLYEIDGRSPIEFCHDLGMEKPSPEYRIAVFESEDSRWYLRTANGNYDTRTGSIVFFADIPLHSKVQLVRATRSGILHAVKSSTQQALALYPGTQPSAGLFFSCANRRQVLGTRAKEEHQMATALVDSVLPTCGFYTYGEIAPLTPNGQSRFHNETFIALFLGSR